MAEVTKVLMIIPQGATYIHTYTYVDSANVAIPLVGFTARMQIRPTVASITVLHEATTENGGIIIDEVAGEVQLIISDTDTTAFDFLTAVYDLELIAPDSTITRLVKGRIEFDPEVTR